MIKLHLGCGKRNFGDSWTHIDGGDFSHLSAHDITKLNFKNDSVDLIYASHVLEYFDRTEVIEILREWNRVLKVGGILRLAVPDFEAMTNLYKSGFPLETFLGPLYGKMEMSGNTIYHKTCYDFNSLRLLLESNNFGDTQKYDWRKTEHSGIDDHSQAYIPHMDKQNGTLISLNIETFKQ